MMKTFQKADIHFGPLFFFFLSFIIIIIFFYLKTLRSLSPRNSMQHCGSCLCEKIQTARKAHSPDFGSSTGNLNSKILKSEDRPLTGAFSPDQADLTWNCSNVIRLRGWMQRRPDFFICFSDRHLNSQIFWFCETDFWFWGLLIVRAYISRVTAKWVDDLFIQLHCQVQCSGTDLCKYCSSCIYPCQYSFCQTCC